MCLGYFVPPAHPSRPHTNVTASGTLSCSRERGPRGTKGSFRVWKTMRGPLGDRQQWGHSSAVAAEASVTNPQVPPPAFPSEGVSPDRTLATKPGGQDQRRAWRPRGQASAPSLAVVVLCPSGGHRPGQRRGKESVGGAPDVRMGGGHEQDQRCVSGAR